MKFRNSLLALILVATSRLAAQSDGTVTVGTAAELIDAVFALNYLDGPRTILLRDGIYTIDNYHTFYLVQPGVTIRSLSGNRDTVVIQGDSVFHADGSRTGGTVPNLFGVAADNFTIEDVSVGNVANHAVQLQIDIDNCVFRNARFFNTGEQMLKVASDGVSDPSDNGLVEDCLFEYPAGIGPQWYIGGIDAHRSRNWIVRRCTFRGIRSPADDVAEHAIHFWRTSSGILVEQNVIVDCDRGVGYGLSADAASGTTGGVIRNNTIYHRAVAGFADVGIGLENAADVQVYNNTILLESGYPNAIEYRFPGTTARIYNNLANTLIRQRDGATSTLANNLTTAQPAWFRAPVTGDLHLASRIPAAVDQGNPIETLTADLDGEPRPQGAGFDIGADEYTEPPACYAAWRAAHFTGTDLSNDAISGPAADPDGCCLSNLGRYGFVLAARGPITPPAAARITSDAGHHYLAISFERRDIGSDVAYLVEASGDLAVWTTISTMAPDSPTNVTLRDNTAVDTATRRFLRVRVRSAP